jgi:hypothetical protein
MSDFDQIKLEAKKFVKENKEFFDRFDNEIDDLTIGNYFDLYLGSKGITALNTGKEFNADYDNALNNFYKDKQNFVNIEQIFIGFLDFLIWLKKQQETFNVNITERKRLHKNALEYSNTINRIYLNKELDKKNKIEVLLFYYCSLQEIFKNVVQEELLLDVWKQGKTDVCDLRKKHIQLGDFKNIIEKYEKQNKLKDKISKIFDVELRNKTLHADYLVNSDEIQYGSKRLGISDLQTKIIKLGVNLQFFVLFYLRLFSETKEVKNE